MAFNDSNPDFLRFGVFELDPASGELRRSGMRVRLPRQAALVLRALLEAGGEPVSRADLRRVLWGEDTFVDFEHSLNFVMARLRRALGDRATQPRYIETLPSVGYRVVAPVTRVPRVAPVPSGASPVVVSAARAAAAPLRLARGLLALGALWLIVQSGGTSVPARAPHHEPPAAAREAYLKGLYHSARSTDEWPAAEEQLRRAVAADPGYADAHGALARVYVRLAEAHLRPAREVLPLARGAASAALAADPSAAEAHLWSGLAALYGEWDWKTAGREIQSALALDPHLPAAHRAHAAYLAAMGDAPGAVEAIDRARGSDPLCPELTGEAGWYRYSAHRYREAVSLWTAAAAVRPVPELHESLLHVYLKQGDAAGAAREAVRAMRAAGVPAAVVDRMARQPPDAVVRAYSRGAIAHLERTSRGAPPERLAALHAALDDRASALSLLERALDERSPGVVRAVRDPAFEPLHHDVRFRRVLARLGLS